MKSLKSKEVNFDDIKCAATYTICSEDLASLWYYIVAIKTCTIICHQQTSVIKEIERLPMTSESKVISNEFLQSNTKIKKSWRNRIEVEVFENKSTLLSIHSNNSGNNIRFDNGKDVLHFNHLFNEIDMVKYNSDYVAIVTGGFRCNHFSRVFSTT